MATYDVYLTLLFAEKNYFKMFALFRLGLLASSSNNCNSTYGYNRYNGCLYKYNYCTLKVLYTFNVCYNNIIKTQ